MLVVVLIDICLISFILNSDIVFVFLDYYFYYTDRNTDRFFS